MAYQTGTVNTPNALLDAFVAFAVANGFTLVAQATENTGKRAHISNSGMFINLRSCLNETTNDTAGAGIVYPRNSNKASGLGISVSTGYTAGQVWRNQPGAPLGYGTTQSAQGQAVSVVMLEQAVNYHFFINGGNHVFAALESGGVWQHFSAGPSIEKAGSFADGMYLYATYSGTQEVSSWPVSTMQPGTTQLSVLVKGAGAWICNGETKSSIGSGYYYAGYTGRSGVTSSQAGAWVEHNQIRSSTVSAMSGQALLLPIKVHAQHSSGTGWSLMGTLPHVFETTAVGSGYASGSTYTLGSDEYVLFPRFAVRKT